MLCDITEEVEVNVCRKALTFWDTRLFRLPDIEFEPLRTIFFSLTVTE
jgi:hypothetical protein